MTNCVLLSAMFWCLASPALRAGVVEVSVDPPSVNLRGITASWSLLVHGKQSDGSIVDRTAGARFRPVDPNVATVSTTGLVGANNDGNTTIVVEVDGRSLPV